MAAVSHEEHVAPRVNAFRNFLAQVCEQVCAEFEREVLQMSEDMSRLSLLSILSVSHIMELISYLFLGYTSNVVLCCLF